MKNWKQFTFVAIIAIVGIIISFMACNNDNETTHEHKWGDWTITKAATCTTEGEETRVCTIDGTKETRPIAIDPNAHLWGDWIITTPATATAEGVETRTCQHNSAHKETRPIEQTEPTKKDFPISFDFVNTDGSSAVRNVIIKDKRTNCGSQNLEQLKVNDKDIVTIIEEAIIGAFNNAPSGPPGATYKNRFRIVFNVEGGVTMYVENTATPYKMKATDVKTIYFHIDYLKNNPTDIQQNIANAVKAMGGDDTLPYNAE